jgi:D-alanyl-D-alanine dipeptidase
MPENIVACFAFLLYCTITSAQSTGKQPLIIMKDVKAYRQVALSDSSYRMASLIKYVPGVKMDLRYSTRNNFTRLQLYPSITDTYMRLPAAIALGRVQKELSKQNLGLVIFDAYRPYHITVRMWELIRDERYVADPAKGSGHNRGTAVDLGLIDLSTKKPLDMGTGFDNFTGTAHHDYTSLPAAVLRNRKLLKDVMEKHGFKPLSTEWWHYSFTSGKEFDVLDLEFKELEE